MDRRIRKPDMTGNGSTLDMTSGRPSALLLRFSVPLILGNLFQQLYTFADTIIVGQKLGVTALSALGASEWLCFMMFGLVQGMTQGFSIGISKHFGEGRNDLVQKGIFQSACVSAGAALLVTAIGQGMLVPALKLLRTPEELFGMTRLYLEILYIGIPVSFAGNMLAAILRTCAEKDRNGKSGTGEPETGREDDACADQAGRADGISEYHHGGRRTGRTVRRQRFRHFIPCRLYGGQ